jgi:hypothetical protein
VAQFSVGDNSQILLLHFAPEIGGGNGLLAWMISFFGLTAFGATTERKTLGMAALKLRLVMRDGTRADEGVCLFRFLLLTLTMTLGILWIANVIFFATKARTSWIDKLLKTEIVDEKSWVERREGDDAKSAPAVVAVVPAVMPSQRSEPQAPAEPTQSAANPAPPISPVNPRPQDIVNNAFKLFSEGQTPAAIGALVAYHRRCGNGTPRQIYQLLMLFYQYAGDRPNFDACALHYQSRFQQAWTAWDDSQVGALPQSIGIALLERNLPLPTGQARGASGAAARRAVADDPRVNDAKAQVAGEVAARDFDAALMARCQAEAGGDAKGALKAYMRMREEQILRNGGS